MGYAARNVESRFWQFVDKRLPDECWPWTGAQSTYGYGQFKTQNRPARYKGAHRFMYEMHHGPISSSVVVRHACDNRRCCNPNHLAVGSHADNVADMVSRGRNSFARQSGTTNGRAVLNEDYVREIRNSEASHQVLADRFGVSKATVAAIRKRRIWNHIT